MNGDRALTQFLLGEIGVGKPEPYNPVACLCRGAQIAKDRRVAVGVRCPDRRVLVESVVAEEHLLRAGSNRAATVTRPLIRSGRPDRLVTRGAK